MTFAVAPSSWVRMPIGEVAATSTGGTPSRSNPNFYGGSIPWVKSGELGDSIVNSAEETLSEEGLHSSSAKLFPSGTVCIALYGATVGKLGLLGIEASTNQAVCGIFLPDGISNRYLFHYLYSIRNKLIEQGKGGAQPNISNGIVKATELPIAPTNEQQRIVAKIEELFSDLDAGVAALERARANLKRYRAAVLKAAVEGRLTAAWRKTHPKAEHAGKLLARILAERRKKWEAAQLAKFAAQGKAPPKGWKDKYPEPAQPDTTNLPELPGGWCWATVDQCSSFDSHAITDGPFGSNLKSEHYTESGPRVIRLQNIGDGFFVDEYAHISRAHFEALKKHSVEAGDLAIAVLGEELPRACIVPDGVAPAIVKADCIRFKPHPDLIMSSYMNYLLNSHPTRVRCSKQIKGVGRPRLNLSHIRNIVVPLPPPLEQRQIVSIAAELFSAEERMEQELGKSIARSVRLRQSILKRAFEGKLVPQDPSDEPASALLARIRAARAKEAAAPKPGRRGRPAKARA